MSEYWVSKKKYFCKYCDIYIADDAPSRQQHENGLRHKGNQERFIRGLYKEGERRKKDADEEKREMARVEQAAQRAFAHDVGSGLAKTGSSNLKPTPSTSAAARKPAAKPSNPYANYSTAESLGYKDPDAERIKVETEQRRMQGVAGEWEIVSAPPAGPSSPLSGEEEPVRKREAEAPSEEDERAFKLRKKTLATGLGEMYDPGIIPIKLKAKKEEPTDDSGETAVTSGSVSNSTPTSSTTEGLLNASMVPKWTKVQWKKGGEVTAEENGTAEKATAEGEEVLSEPSIKAEEDSQLVLSNESEPTKRESAPFKSESSLTSGPLASNSGSSLFKKRKIPANRAIR